MANKVRLLELPAGTQTAVRERKLSERQALAMLPVVEMAAKLNGTVVDWDKGKVQEIYGRPIAPEAFMRFVTDKPEVATSDRIRDYARRALDHAGAPLPEAIATFEAGDHESIVQRLCAGCRYRHNQHCLNRPCRDAKWEELRAQIPRRAAEHTGLPWSDDAAAFTKDRDHADHLRHLYGSGKRDGLVVSWTPVGWREDWLEGKTGFRNAQEIMDDWRKGLVLGRLPHPDDEVDGASIQPPVSVWRSMRYDANQARKERVKQALVDACAPLAGQDAFRPLLALVEAKNIAGFIDYFWRSTAYLSYARDRNELVAILQKAGLDAALADPVDVGDRLHEVAAEALADWYDYRDRSSGRTAAAAVALGKALDAFEAAGITAEREESDLVDLLGWLTIARAEAVEVVNGGKTA